MRIKKGDQSISKSVIEEEKSLSKIDISSRMQTPIKESIVDENYEEE